MRMNVEVRTLTGRSLTVHTKQEATVRDVQNEIAKTEGLPVIRQQLMVSERKLFSEERLGDIVMEYGQEIYLLSTVRAGTEVKISCINGDHFYISIDDATTVLQLKMGILDKRYIAVQSQRLVISDGSNEIEMQDRKKVTSYFVNGQSEYTIFLLMKGFIGKRGTEEPAIEQMGMEPEANVGSTWKFACCCFI